MRKYQYLWLHQVNLTLSSVLLKSTCYSEKLDTFGSTEQCDVDKARSGLAGVPTIPIHTVKQIAQSDQIRSISS